MTRVFEYIFQLFVHIGAHFDPFTLRICIILATFLVHKIPVSSHNVKYTPLRVGIGNVLTYYVR